MTMMLALTVREVESSGSAVTFRLSGNRALTLPHKGKWRGRKGRRDGGGSARGGMQEIAVMMRMKEGDSERQGERV